MPENLFKLRVTIRDGNRVVRGVPCEVRLPERASGPVELRLRSERPHRLGYPFQFSVSGQTRRDGRVVRTVRASRVYRKQEGGTTYWAPNLAEENLIGEPMDLSITNRIGGRHEPYVAFWLTPNLHLRADKIREQSYTGGVRVLSNRRRRFTIGEITFIFDNHFRYLRELDGREVSFSELVAVAPVPMRAIPDVLRQLNDVLLLAGVAARQRTVCVGWEATEASTHVRHYRRGISIPVEKKNHGFNDVLIEPEHFSRFLRRAYATFRAAPEQELLRQALHRLVYDGGASDIASSYMRFFGAAEALVLRHSRLHGGDAILSSPRWRRTAKTLRSAIRNSDGVSTPEADLLIEKVPELNRVTFGSAAHTLCAAHSVDLSDLWPLAGSAGGPSLSAIRNRIAHGDTVGDGEMGALILAHEHLRWTAERIALGVLRWSADRSRVYPHVSESIPGQTVEQARQHLASKWRRQVE